MKILLLAGLAATALSYGATIDISTGVAAWKVSGPGVSGLVSATPLSNAEQNSNWAPPPAGSAWISWASNEGHGCAVSGCADANFAATDTWLYTLNISAAALDATSGDLNVIFGGDDSVTLSVPNGFSDASPSAGFNSLTCSGTPPTSTGNTQANYNNCTGLLFFDASNLNVDGSLTLTATVLNSAANVCSGCANPTAFILEGELLSGVDATQPPAVPEPGTFVLVSLAGLAFFVPRRAYILKQQMRRRR